MIILLHMKEFRFFARIGKSEGYLQPNPKSQRATTHCNYFALKGSGVILNCQDQEAVAKSSSLRQLIATMPLLSSPTNSGIISKNNTELIQYLCHRLKMQLKNLVSLQKTRINKEGITIFGFPIRKQCI